jgi:nicotine blue oxidoreductase
VVIEGERLVDRAVRILSQAGADPVLVVLGAWQGSVPGASTVLNPQWPTGMGSIACRPPGTRHPAHRGTDAVLVTLVDLPGLTVPAVQRVLHTRAELVVATYDGVRGHPAKFGRRHWGGIVAASARGDAGAREYLRNGSDLVLVEVGDVATGQDLDRPADSAHWPVHRIGHDPPAVLLARLRPSRSVPADPTGALTPGGRRARRPSPC